MGQFLTPPAVASLLAGFFEPSEEDVHLLDPGAGMGALTAAFVEAVLDRRPMPRSLSLTAWEVERRFVDHLRQVLEVCVEMGKTAGVPTRFVLNHGDFLKEGEALLDEEDLFRGNRKAPGFTHVIMNPPYHKIHSGSAARTSLRRAGLETSNLYTGFLWLGARFLKAEGQMVAITPRSFCNGPYFTPFRKQFLAIMALEKLHVFERRDALFAEDKVLQENVILCARRTTKPRAIVKLSSTGGTAEGATRSRTVPYARVVDPADASHVVHLALGEADDEVKRAIMGLPASLSELGLEVSTGRVVDFRARDFLRQMPGEDTVPLIYPMHFNGGCVHWPRSKNRKPNALLKAPETEELLVPNGLYLLVKRFTSKEERKRVVATLFRPEGDLADFSAVGFENHLNYFHAKGRPLSSKLAEGLSIFLNSSLVDSYFRQFSGHTQVNAADLRNLRYPSREQLAGLAERLPGGSHTQEATDAAVGAMIRTSQRSVA